LQARCNAPSTEEKVEVQMNFLIHRAEVIFLTGINRTQTFDLQREEQLKVVSKLAGKSWFELSDVLLCLANLHGLPPPDLDSTQTYAKMAVEQRSRKLSQRVQQKAEN
jgi:hypothetical protein